MNDLIWLNANDLMIFGKSTFLQKYINKGGTIPLLNVKWIAKNGDYVHNGDIIFTANINIDGYQHNKYTVEYDEEINKYGEVIAKVVKDGIFFTKNNQSYFECNTKRPICAICDNKELYDDISKKNQFIIKENDYTDYSLYKSSNKYRDEFSDNETKIFIHNFLKLTNFGNFKVIDLITNWLLGERENNLTYGSYGKNEMNQKHTSFYINEDLSVDCLTDLFYCDSIPEFITFRKVNGDFHTHANTGTLKGCPIYVNGDFECPHWSCAKKEALKNFNFIPLYIEGSCIVKHHNISSFEGMPLYIGGVLNISNNNFTDESWEYAKNNIDADFRDYNIKKNKFVKYRKELY
jgi:hypothetical protein